MVGLGDLPGREATSGASLRMFSGDGNVIVGDGTGESGLRAVSLDPL